MSQLKRCSALSLLIVLIVTTFFGQSKSTKRTFIWGINGHCVSNRAPYENSIDTQLSQLKAIGFTYYRNDIAVALNGRVSNAARFKELLKKAPLYNVKILPMIYDCWRPELSNTRNYNNGYSLGLNFAKVYGKQLSAIEIGNEKDMAVFGNPNYVKTAIPADGQLPGHYFRSKANSLAACLDGMADGIHKANRKIKVIINCSNHPRWGYFKILEEQGVSYDIVGVHWYTSSGSLLNIYGQNGLKMFAQFKKPIWITEINRGGGSFSENGKDNEADALATLVSEIHPYKSVQAFFVYELYDNESYKQQNNMEGYFGIYDKPSKGKSSVSRLKKIIKSKK